MKEILKFLRNIEPREYQKQIFKTCKEKNCLVVLPTGIGKTLIALLLSIHRLQQYPNSKILFLAPTRPLAQQHLHYFEKHLPELFAYLELFTGKVKAEKRKKLWERADIIFSTPQCIANDLKSNLYDLNNISLLIEDECHRCLKNYSYTYVAKKYKEQASNPRILGLTASPGHEKSKIKEICKNLNIEAVETRTRKSEDVKQYIQPLNFQIEKVDFPEKFEEIRQLIKEVCDKKIEELKNRKLLFGKATKFTLLETQSKIMKALASGNRNFNLLAGASACAIAIKLQHLLELLETQTLSSVQSYFLDLFKQAEQGKSRAVKQLVKSPQFNKAYTLLIELIARNQEHPKLEKLKEIVKKEFLENKKYKIIVFAQYRETVTRICKELNSIPEINARVFVGQARKLSGRGIEFGKEVTGLSQREQQALIREFSLGKVNVLASTSIGEEGLDIPEVNAVIFYEPIPSAIRQIQRRGRTARLQKGKLIVLITKGTRDEAYYWAAFHKEKKMHSALNNIKEDLENNFNNKEKEKQDTLF